MSDIELRDSIAKELFVTLILRNDTSYGPEQRLATHCFNSADIFMEEKLRRAAKVMRNPIGGV